MLANGTRLRLLLRLQQPTRLADIRLDSGGRPISRQAVHKHLTALEDIGAVVRMEEGDVRQYMVRHARLYEIVEGLRPLATLRAAVRLDDVTRELDAVALPVRPPGAHLVTVRGVEEGRTFLLDSPDAEGGWTLGRHGDVQLDHDQFISGRHARLLQRGTRHYLLDLASNRNGTTLNWRPMEKGALAPLEPGDVIGLGMTRLVYRVAQTP